MLIGLGKSLWKNTTAKRKIDMAWYEDPVMFTVVSVLIISFSYIIISIVRRIRI
jgi:hypothetical protein